MQMRNFFKFSAIMQKVKKFFFPISFILRLIPFDIPKKYKIVATYCTAATKKHISKRWTGSTSDVINITYVLQLQRIEIL